MCLQNRQRQKPHTKSTVSSSFPILITLQFTNKAKNKILILIFKKLPNVNCKSPSLPSPTPHHYNCAFASRFPVTSHVRKPIAWSVVPVSKHALTLSLCHPPSHQVQNYVSSYHHIQTLQSWAARRIFLFLFYCFVK